VDGKDAWKVAGKLLTPFDLAQLAGTADQIQKRLIEAAREIEEMTAAHDAAVLKDDLLVSGPSCPMQERDMGFCVSMRCIYLLS
jgi:hypothetical protein